MGIVIPLSIGLSHPRGVTMLAEIFMLRLEAAAWALRETPLPRASQFVSVTSNSQVTFKESRKRPSEVVREVPTKG